MANMRQVAIKADGNKWDRFIKIAKHNNSDASKEIRKFMDKYLSENSQLFLK